MQWCDNNTQTMLHLLTQYENRYGYGYYGAFIRRSHHHAISFSSWIETSILFLHLLLAQKTFNMPNFAMQIYSEQVEYNNIECLCLHEE